MLFDPARHGVDGLETKIRQARALTPALMSTVMAASCVRLGSLSQADKSRLDRLIAAGAWLDAVLTLCELEFPHWKLRRIVCDDGEWVCSLARAPLLPLELDETEEATHEVLPLALLLAFVRARRANPVRASSATIVPHVSPPGGHVMCCDNFV